MNLPRTRRGQRERPLYMRWAKPSLRNGVHSLLGKSGGGIGMDRDGRLENLRDAMLDCIDARHATGMTPFAQMFTRIRHSNSAEDLWYLRGDLMALLSSLHGEAQAREKVDVLTPLFEGLLPPGLTRTRGRSGH